MWLVGRLKPDFKTIAEFRKNNGRGIQQTCREFVCVCRMMEVFSESLAAIDGSKFKVVNSKKKNDTRASMKRQIARTEKHIEDYLNRLDSVDSKGSDIDEQKQPEFKGLDTLLSNLKLTKSCKDSSLQSEIQEAISNFSPEKSKLNLDTRIISRHFLNVSLSAVENDRLLGGHS